VTTQFVLGLSTIVLLAGIGLSYAANRLVTGHIYRYSRRRSLLLASILWIDFYAVLLSVFLDPQDFWAILMSWVVANLAVASLLVARRQGRARRNDGSDST
jgi:predicted MFS family arabinose efflux permease